MTDEIQQWAKDKVFSLTGPMQYDPGSNIAGVCAAFARYIMQHEEPPVDKDVLAVREILAEANHYAGDDGHNSYMSGANDSDDHFQDALAAYRKHKQ